MPPNHGRKPPPKRIDQGGNPNQNRKIVQANLQDRAWVENNTGTRMMGTNADERPLNKLQGFDYGKNGTWTNRNRTQVATSFGEDGTINPSKSTGDFGNAIHIHLHGNDSGFNVQKAAKLRNKKYKGKAGY